MIGVRDLHHRRLQVQRKQDALLSGSTHLVTQEVDERVPAHEGGVEHLTLLQGQALLQDSRRPVRSDVDDPGRRCGGERDRLLVVTEVAGGIVDT